MKKFWFARHFFQNPLFRCITLCIIGFINKPVHTYIYVNEKPSPHFTSPMNSASILWPRKLVGDVTEPIGCVQLWPIFGSHLRDEADEGRNALDIFIKTVAKIGLDSEVAKLPRSGWAIIIPMEMWNNWPCPISLENDIVFVEKYIGLLMRDIAIFSCSWYTNNLIGLMGLYVKTTITINYEFALYICFIYFLVRFIETHILDTVDIHFKKMRFC